MKVSESAIVVGLILFLAVPISADTLLLQGGERLTGSFEGATAQTVRFRTSDGNVRSFEVSKILQIQFGNDSAPSHSASSPSHAATDASPYLVPSGTRIIIRTVDVINSDKQRVGEEFRAMLDAPIVVEGVDVVSRDSEIRGRITDVSEVERAAGTVELSLELTQLIVNGMHFALSTSEYSDARIAPVGGPTPRGALGAVDAITGEVKTAPIGGAGAAGAEAVPDIKVVARGEKISIPAGTRLQFTLRTPLAIARN